MDSPFPGMDPYLEDPAFWRDFHHVFIDCWREAIADVLPEAYEARLDERVEIVPLSEEDIKPIYPDVAVTRRKKRLGRGSASGGTAVLNPVVIPHAIIGEQPRQAYIRIFKRPGRSLVAVLELLSPSNKIGDGFMDYCGKRSTLLYGRTHLVELDLLMGGRRLPLAKPLPPGDYFAMISRGDQRPNCEVYAWSLREPLPAIPIPLRAPDADVFVDLQAVFCQTYQRGRYAPSLRYGKAPEAPLGAKDKRWAMAQKPR